MKQMFADYAKAIDYMISIRSQHPIMDVELIHGTKFYVVIVEES